MFAIEVCSSLPSRLSATLTIVVSRIDMIEPRITISAIRQTQGSIRSVAAGFIRIQKVSGRLGLRGALGRGWARAGMGWGRLGCCCSCFDAGHERADEDRAGGEDRG